MNLTRSQFFVALGFALLAAGLALIRKSEIVQERVSTDFVIGQRNSLEWDPTSGIFEVAGDDPFGMIELPASSLPLHELRLEFTGPFQPDGWYLYFAPEHLPTTVDQRWVKPPTVEITASGHALIWHLPDSLLARIDFPDDLQIPVRRDRAVFRARVASSSSATFSAAVVAAALALFLPLGIHLRPHLSVKAFEWTLIATLLVTKLWLTSDIGMTLRPQLMHDDLLFMTQAASIHNGEWLGEFWQLTLAKGPIYSIFVALSAASGLSLQFNELLFHGLACIAFVGALSPWLRRPEWRLLLLSVLLFEAYALSPEIFGRVLRGAIQPALTLFTLAGLLGMVTRAKCHAKFVWPWALLAGLAGSAFWFSREEGIWPVPTMVLLLGTFAWTSWLTAAAHRMAWLSCLALPFAVFLGAKFTLHSINHAYYGVSIGVDVNEGGFPAAYGAMMRVHSPDQIPGVAITTTTRDLIYPHSPAFAELAAELDGPVTAIWGPAGWGENNPHPRANLEIRGGWYQWALREAATRSGYYRSAPKTQAYWQRVADEINAAVDSGHLAGGARRHGFFPVWHDSYLLPVFVNWFKSLDLIVRFTNFRPRGSSSEGNLIDILAHAKFLNVDPVIEPRPATIKSHLRMILYRVFSLLGWPLTGIALLATGIVIKRSWIQRHARPQVAVLLSLWGGAAALLLVVALVHVTSFAALTGSYLGPVAPLIISAWILAPLFAWASPPIVIYTRRKR